MGETALDEETFDDYIQEMRQHYTADKVRACTRVYAMQCTYMRAVSSTRCAVSTICTFGTTAHRS